MSIVTNQPILFHVGYYKTASTWLDREFFKESKFIHRVGNDYSERRQFNLTFVRGASGEILAPNDYNTDEIKNTFKKFIKGTDSQKLVISAERLVGSPYSGGFDAEIIAKRIAAGFPCAKILIVIREQKEFIVSNYCQYIRSGGGQSFDQYYTHINRDVLLPGFSFSYLEYYHLVSHYIDLFGKDNVLVLPFEMLVDSPESFGFEISSFMEVDFTKTGVDFTKKINSTNYLKLPIYRHLNLFRTKSSLNGHSILYNPIARILINEFADLCALVLPEKLGDILKQRFKRKAEQIIGDKYREVNKKLAELINIDLAEYGYY